MSHPRIVVQLGQLASLQRLPALLSDLEREGFDGVSFPDHIEERSAPIASVALAAASSSHLSVSALVLNNDLRHPAVIAAEFATLSAAFPGRIRLGMGAGWQAADFEHLGARFDRAATRVDRLAEALEILAQLRERGEARLAGRYYQPNGFRLPGGQAGFSLVVGGGGERVLALAARYADIVSVNPSLARPNSRRAVADELTLASYRRKLEIVRRRAELARRSPEIQLRTAFVHIGRDAPSVLRDLARAYLVDPTDALAMPAVLIGTAAEVAEKILATSEALGVEEWVVHEPDRTAMAEVLGSIRAHT
jgi:probable F420-dependent oxidoreductase